MLTLSRIEENKDELVKLLKLKNFDAAPIFEEIISLNNERKTSQQEVNEAQAKMNSNAKKIGMLFKEGKRDEAEAAKNESAGLKDLIKDLGQRQNEIQDKLNDLLVQVPNIPHPSVPEGKSDADNKEIKTGGSMPNMFSDAKPHWELAEQYDIIDFDLGVKLTGAGFPVFKGKGARLQRALINFFLNEAEKNGFKEVLPPILVNEDSGFGTGQLPDKEGQMYHATADNLYLIPTAEVPVTNIYRDVILDEKDFPLKNTAYTPCFRREAGSYGKDVRGLNRLHQFDKVEIVCIEHPEKSYAMLDKMVAHVEELIKKLELPYRIVQLCGGDLSFTSALTYDFEVYSAAQERWLEVSSVSNFENYQANRLKLRYKSPEHKKPQLAHTLNGSALALPRIMAALLENNQSPNGIIIPEVLRPYTGFDKID